MPGRIPLAASLLLLLAAFAPAPAAAAAEPLRLAGRAFDRRAEIEVRDLDREAARAAITAGFRTLEQARADLRGLEEMTRDGRPVELDPGAAGLLTRALGVCEWSEGAVGPAGGEVFALWGLRFAVTSFPVPEEIDRAVASARCERVRLDTASRRLEVAAGTRLDLFPFELGWAIDRAAEALRAAGARNFWIELGPLVRAAGGGPHGDGWPLAPPLLPGQDEPLAPFTLRDRAAAILRPGDRPLRIAGESFAPYLDLRRGRPIPNGVAAVLVVSELAVDAQAVGYAMFALGPRDGTLLLGALMPRPSIRWLLGSGQGPPVLTDVNWGAIQRAELRR